MTKKHTKNNKLKMTYHIFLEGRTRAQFEIVEAESYSTHGDFVDFFVNINQREYNVASFKSKNVCSIISQSDDPKKQREDKLNRILWEPRFWERTGKKLDKVFRKKKK